MRTLLGMLAFVVLALFHESHAQDCNNNGIDDACDIDCGLQTGPCDVPGCGGSDDCNSNSLPDECEVISGAYAYRFSGSEYIFIPNTDSLSISSSLTIELWARGPGQASGTQMLLIKGDDQSARDPYFLRFRNGNLDFGFDDDSNVRSDILEPVDHLDWTTYHHVAAVFDDTADEMRLFVDGVFLGSETTLLSPMANQAPHYITIGGTVGSGMRLIGDLDEIRIWQIAREQEDLIETMNSSLFGNEPGLVAYWRFNEGGGQEVFDVTPNDNDGFLGGDPDPGGDSADPMVINSTIPTRLTDCDADGALDECQIADDASLDCDMNEILDQCEQGGPSDCDDNGIPDSCQIADCTPGDPSCADCNLDGVLDVCEVGTGGLSFGGGDFVQLPANFLPWLTSDTTIEVWFKTAGSGVIFGQQVQTPFDSVSGHVPMLYVGLDGNLRAEYWWGSPTPMVSPSAVNDNLWHHAALTYDGQMARLYLDGQEVAQRTASLSGYSGLLNYQLGTGYTGANWPSTNDNWFTFAGQLDEFRVWSVARSQQEIVDDMNRPLSGIYANLIANLKMNDGSGQIVEDASGSGNHGSLGTDPAAVDPNDPVWNPIGAPSVTADCNTNGIPDECDVTSGVSLDCNATGIPDECEILPTEDCDNDGEIDLCEIAGGGSDCDLDGVPDECQLTANDCNSNLVPDNCEPDCNNNNVVDECDVVNMTSDDCDASGVPDECQIATINASLFFNGVADVVEVQQAPELQPQSEFTIEAWVRADGFGPVFSRIFSNGDVTGAGGFALAWRQSNNLRAQLLVRNAGSPAIVSIADTTTTDNYVAEWHHVAGVYSSSTDVAQLFVDGVLKNEQTDIGPLDYAPGDLRIGNGLDLSTHGFDGLVDEVRLWNIARTGQELQGAMFRSLSGNEPGLVGYWQFNDFGDQIALDGTGNGNDGTLGTGPGVDASDPQTSFLLTPIYPSDCNANDELDSCEIAAMSVQDCNSNLIPDECEPQLDCNANGLLDSCDLLSGSSEDCNNNLVPDDCEPGGQQDCDSDGTTDLCTIFMGLQPDCDNNFVPDGCEPDLDGDTLIDGCDNCPFRPNIKQADEDNDNVGDLCDNCLELSNPSQDDSDFDGLGDACDNCPFHPNSLNQNDDDADGVGDVCDQCPNFDDNIDTDGDGLADACDSCPTRKTGDVNGDDLVNGDDIGPFVDVLLNGTGILDELCASDVDLSGVVEQADVVPFVNCVLDGLCSAP